MSSSTTFDEARFERLLADQYSVVSRGQALGCGISRGRLDHLVGPGGRWQRIVAGVYAPTTGTVTPDQRAMAALLHAGPQSVITGASAVRRHGLNCVGLNEVDVLVPVGVRVQSTGFVRVIHTTRMPEQYFSTRQVRFARPSRAVADAARGMTRLGDVRAVVGAAVQHRKCDIASLVAELNDGPVIGSRLFRRALREISDGVRSAAEADLKFLVDRSDLERPVYNAKLYAADGTFLGIADAWWERAGVAAEVDSRQYHLSPADYEYTTDRHNRMESAGINLLHFLPGTLRQKSPKVIARLRGAIAAGNSRPPLPVTTRPSQA